VKASRKQKVLYCIKFGVVFVLALWGILTYVVSPVMVNGTSMVPTLQSGNILLDWRLPQTWAKLTGSQYIPNRSNIVIVYAPYLNKVIVKRVIGLPDEKITVSNGSVTVYNAAYPKGFHPDSAPYGKLLTPTAGAFSGNTGDGQIFVMGDNRAIGASIDSRSSIGNIPSRNIVGHVIVRIFPFNEITLF
jgi:signal peptidase I